ncbi:MAG: hypothetical protein RL701_1124 [Pseudomonadota bacterium]
MKNRRLLTKSFTALILGSAGIMLVSACDGRGQAAPANALGATPSAAIGGGTGAVGTVIPNGPSTGGVAAAPPAIIPVVAGTGGAPPVVNTAGAAGVAAPAAAGAGAGIGGVAPAVPVTSGLSEWRVMGYSAASTYFNTAETVLTKANAATLEVAWQADMGDNVYGAALQVGDKIYASSGTVVQAFNAADGAKLWRNTRAGTTAAMSYDEVDGGTLYLNNNAGQVVALKAADGVQKWAQAPTTQTADGSSSPVVAGDYVLVGGSAGSQEILGTSRFRGYLAALDKVTGSVKWVGYTVPENARGASLWSSGSADLLNKRAYGATGNNHGTPNTDSSDAIIAFDLDTGAIIWKNQRTKNDNWSGSSAGPDHDFGANPVLYETLVNGVMTQMVSGAQKSGSAHGFRRDTGEMLWTRSLGGGSNNGAAGVFTNATWSGKNMLFACNGGGGSTLYALDGATGEIAWQRTLTGAVYGRISVANGVGFVGAGSSLEVFDIDTGANIKTIAGKGGTLASTITIANGRVAFGEGMSWNASRTGSTLTVLKVK